jgi:hypothetical protein
VPEGTHWHDSTWQEHVHDTHVAWPVASH